MLRMRNVGLLSIRSPVRVTTHDGYVPGTVSCIFNGKCRTTNYSVLQTSKRRRYRFETMSFSSLADRIVCINLREREDRYELCKKRFADVGLQEEDVHFLRVERHPNGGRYGCYDSHRMVMKQAHDDGLNSVLIFEDDVEFRDGWEMVVQEAIQFLDSATEFDALMLGPEL